MVNVEAALTASHCHVPDKQSYKVGFRPGCDHAFRKIERVMIILCKSTRNSKDPRRAWLSEHVAFQLRFRLRMISL